MALHPTIRAALSATLLLGLWSCASPSESKTSGSAGTLLVIGGGLDDDAAPIFGRFLELAARPGTPRVVVMTAASGDQDGEGGAKLAALQVHAPEVLVSVVRRETPSATAILEIDAATALLFTGGDQARITARYLGSPEALAMQRLLARGGVIAGCSAGDAMLGANMLLSGSSAAALGIGTASAPSSGPRVGEGMGFLPWAITDSHFFERDRVGRLVAALAATGQRFGIGVGEDGAVEIDLASRTVRGVGVAESLLVDTAHLVRDGLRRKNLVARVLARGDSVTLTESRGLGQPVPRPHGAPSDVAVLEPGQNRQLASWRLFRLASRPGTGAFRLALTGWEVTAWPNGDGTVAFEAAPHSR